MTSRALDKYESFLWLLSQNEPWMLQWNVGVSGVVPKAQVEQALALVQNFSLFQKAWQVLFRRHPLLHSVAVIQGERLLFFRSSRV